jgi:hypothetical protein
MGKIDAERAGERGENKLKNVYMLQFTRQRGKEIKRLLS